MPRRAAHPSLAEQHAASGGVVAVDRALTLLAAFSAGKPQLSLAELAAATHQYKSTVLRLLASLEHAHLVQRQADGRYALGAAVARLHAAYASGFSLEAAVMPALRELVEATRESAAFHVRQGDKRLCLYRVDSPQPVRDHIRTGDLLPLERGTGGRVLMAFSGARGARYTQIRRDQVLVASGDRVPELAGISAPVFGAAGELVGAVTLTMPAPRLNAAHAPQVCRAARQVTAGLGGVYPPPRE
jgi:DNA-binding IclR family transcriptional regulator